MDRRPSRRKRKKASGNGALIGALIGVAVLLLIGIGVGVTLLMRAPQQVVVVQQPDNPNPGQPVARPIPPAQNPPVQNPPVQAPPVQNPPAQNPPVQAPPVQVPPVQTAPMQAPPVQNPPAQNPPVQAPPVQQPPVQKPPVRPQQPEPPVAVGDMPQNVLERIRQATAFIRVQAGTKGTTGSGFVVHVSDTTAYVVTNLHVVDVVDTAPQQAPPPQIESKFGLPKTKFGGGGGPPYGPRPFGGPGGPPYGPYGGIGRQIAPPPAAKIRPTISVVLRSGTPQEQTVNAELVAMDEDRDLATLRILGVADLPKPLDISQNAPLRETMGVYIFGYPFGKALANGGANPQATINRGTISGLRRDENNELSTVQINGDLNPGNSGGPIVDAAGRLVGISVSSVLGANIGFAIPAADLTEMFKGRAFLSFVFQPRPDNGNIALDGEVWALSRQGAVLTRDVIHINGPSAAGANFPADEFSVMVFMSDPMQKVRSPALHLIQTEKVVPRAHPDTRWEPLAGAKKVPLQIQDSKARGVFTVPKDKHNAGHAFQISYVNADGQEFYTQPHFVRVGFPKDPKEMYIHVTHIPDEATRRYLGDHIPKQLGGDGVNVGLQGGTNEVRLVLNPVTDPNAIRQKINFGDVTDGSGWSLTVKYKELKLPLPTDADIDSALEDLKAAGDAMRQLRGVNKLADVYREHPGRRQEAAKAIEQYLSAPLDDNGISAGLRAMLMWSGPENHLGVSKFLASNNGGVRQMAFRIVSSTKDPAMLPALALYYPHDRGNCGKLLKTFGAVAEKHVIPLLKDGSDVWGTRDVCDVLAHIGTAESISALEALVNNPKANGFSKRSASGAIDTLKKKLK